MTHKDIYIKFMIEYDKANVTSSYPSLTEYEVATVLDKAYNAIIAQKVTGNNVRRAGFETDTKAMEDLAPLVIQDKISLVLATDVAANVYRGDLSDDHLYFIDSYLKKNTPFKSYAFLAPEPSDTKSESVTRYRTGKFIDDSDNPSIFDSTGDYFYLFSPKDIEEGTYHKKAKLNSTEIDNDNITFKCHICAKDSASVITGDYDHYTPLSETDPDHASYYELDFSNGSTIDCNTILDTITHVDDWENLDIKLAFEPYGDFNPVEGQPIPNITIDYIDDVYNYPIGDPIDGVTSRNVPVTLVTHQIAKRFFSTSYNIPWIKNPVCYIENDNSDNTYDNAHKSKDEIYVVVDPWDTPIVVGTDTLNVVYIKRPNRFVKNLSDNPTTYESFFDPGTAGPTVKNQYVFELNDTVAEEVISLAVTFALENVESTRLNSKLNMRGLEA